ncbi:MAG: SUMF1/EgtB/PvdO family nonheme iron enzyme, partial [Opitutaceae bacterium]|nr:SUMF1/EgtB/PvdO family nonheme iron enzyme [Opitutaceae bacterium]
LDAVRPGVILEGEGTPPQAQIADHHASWAQWFDDSEVPGVLRHKWFERRHLQHQTQRWNTDHSAEIHTAWMNGSGLMIWENVFGAWVPYNERDRSLLRAMLPVQRRFTALFSGEGWTPLVPVGQPDTYASLWTHDGVRLWTLVNRTARTVAGALLDLPVAPGERYFDLIAGRELYPTIHDGVATLSATLPPRGLGGLLALPAAQVTPDFEQFLSAQAATHARANYDTTTPRRATHTVPVKRTPPAATVPPGMIAAPYCWKKYLSTQMRIRECGLYDATAIEELPFRESYQFQVRDFTRPVKLSPFAMDETPVTNAQFAAFLAASGYRPVQSENFLKHWSDGNPPADKTDHPVVWVGLDDARAYAAWAGKRLPTEDEWQHAAQNGDGREYPWGNGLRAGVCNLGETADTTSVKAFPAGRTPAGLYDLCGNVWHWTESEASEGRTRYAMLRGGSHFAAQGSCWYVDGGPRPASFTTKLLLMWPGLDRSATIGFRCVVDLA